MRIVKKKGDLASWYQLFDQMKAIVLDGLLLAPENHHSESLDSNDSDWSDLLSKLVWIVYFIQGLYQKEWKQTLIVKSKN